MGDHGLPPPGPSLLELKTIYEGPGGRAAARFLKKTTLIVTNRTVEIEREGANVCMTVATMGCWYMFFQTASIEIYEVSTPYPKTRAATFRRRPSERRKRQPSASTPHAHRGTDSFTHALAFALVPPLFVSSLLCALPNLVRASSWYARVAPHSFDEGS